MKGGPLFVVIRLHEKQLMPWNTESSMPCCIADLILDVMRCKQ